MSVVAESSHRGSAPEDSAFLARRRIRLRELWSPSESGLDLRNTWQILVGAVLVPAGFAAIVLGWAGAAHGRVDQQQIPYLISGGLLGLAAVIVGSFLFWAHWLYRIYDQADLHHQAAMQEQAEFHRAMLQTLGAAPIGALVGASVNDGKVGALTAEYVATPSGTNFHHPECPIVARHASLRPVSAADAKQMRPCRICEPS